MPFGDRVILYKVITKLVRLLSNDKLNGGAVSITFDDQLHSAYANALPVLERYGFKSTWYICVDTIGKYDSEFRESAITWEEIRSLQRLNHEIGSHTMTHCDFDTTPLDAITKELLDSRNILASNINFPVKSFAYPFTRIGKDVKGPRVAASHYQSARGGDCGFNRSPLRRESLYAWKLYQNKYSLDYLKALVDICILQNCWLIFYTHDVKTDCSDYGCTSELFEQLMSYINKKKIKVDTVNNIINIIGG